jgi:hypothetical protein
MADTAVVFFGVRLEVGEFEIELLENRSHSAVLNAKKEGLQHYWGNFGGPGERYYLFVGKSLARLGVEDSSEVSINAREFDQIATDVSNRLSRAGFSEVPLLYLQFQPDQ